MQSLARICLIVALPLVMSKSVAADSMPLLAIDVGHSKLRPGATSSRGRPEFEFNVDLAKSIHDLMTSNNIRTLQIGDDGNLVALAQRTVTAKDAGAAFFLSVHHDSVQPHYLKSWQWQGVVQQYSDNFSGFSLFISRKNPQLATSLQCASAMGAALQQKGLHPSSHHAENIAGEGKEWADQQHGVYYYDNLVVLKTAAMPAVLLEAGVIVNRDEEQTIQQASVRITIAEAIALGLQRCGLLKTPDKIKP